MARIPIKRENKPDADVENDEELETEGEEKNPNGDAQTPAEVSSDANLGRAETVIPVKPPAPVPPAPPTAPEAPQAKEPRAHVAKRFQVRSSPGRIVYAGQVMNLPPGKIIDSRSVSPEILRQQGVVLAELPDVVD